MGDFDIAFPPGYGGASPDHNHAHEAISTVLPDQHHAKSHAHDGADGSGTVAYIPVARAKTGLYYTSYSSSVTTNAQALGTLSVSPFPFAGGTLDRIGIECTSAGTAGNTTRLGIYADAGAHYPGALVLDAGTVVADATGFHEITIAQVLAAGMYWLGAANQGATTPGTLRASAQGSLVVGAQNAGTASTTNICGFSQTGVTGALPMPFSTTVTFTAVAMRVFVRAA